MAALREWDWDARSVLRTTLIVLAVALAVYVTTCSASRSRGS